MIKIYKNHYALPWFMQGHILFNVVQQIELSRNLKRVKKSNYFAIRLNLN